MTTSKNWMAELAAHYETIKRRYPNDQLMILFDIDGTILDMRYMVWRLLKTYDRRHGTGFFATLSVDDITVHEERVKPLLDDLQIATADQKDILTWYQAHAWSAEAMLEAHRPFSTVLEVIRWFQLQPNTTVGLNTGRPESIREETRRCLNKLGHEYKVQFTDDLLVMRPDHWVADVPLAKVAGVKYFQDKGYRVFAFVDNEPDNLELIADIDPNDEILLLHADTIFNSKRTQLPSRAIGGKVYDLKSLISEEALPRHIQFVWHGIDTMSRLNHFLLSDVHWGELGVQLDVAGHNLIIQSDALSRPPAQSPLYLEDVLTHLQGRSKGIKLDLQVGHQEALDRVLGLVHRLGFQHHHLWFSGHVETLQENGFKLISRAFPGAVVQCPVDFLAPLVCTSPAKAKEILDMFVTWGVNRFAINWHTANLRPFFDQMDRWGFEINIYNVPNLEAFLQAVLLMPRAVTSDFDFPEWHYVTPETVGNFGDNHELFVQEVSLV